jgi:hypothetical protein
VDDDIERFRVVDLFGEAPHVIADREVCYDESGPTLDQGRERPSAFAVPCMYDEVVSLRQQ